MKFFLVFQTIFTLGALSYLCGLKFLCHGWDHIFSIQPVFFYYCLGNHQLLPFETQCSIYFCIIPSKVERVHSTSYLPQGYSVLKMDLKISEHFHFKYWWLADNGLFTRWVDQWIMSMVHVISMEEKAFDLIVSNLA